MSSPSVPEPEPLNPIELAIAKVAVEYAMYDCDVYKNRPEWNAFRGLHIRLVALLESSSRQLDKPNKQAAGL